MSSLLEDIIATAIDNKQPLAVVLRKCVLLGHELKNDRLKAWASKELNGYESSDDLPEYRIIPADARGNFSGPFQSGMRNWPIPPVALEKEHRGFAEQVFLMQAISGLENATKSDGNLQFPWPGNLNVLYQTRFFQGRFTLISAWQEVSVSAIVGLLDTVRNWTLSMALEIKDELGTSYEDLRSINSSEAARVQNIIVQHIQGGTNYLNLGDATIDSSTKTETVINIGNRKRLDEILIAAGLDATDLAGR